MKRNKTSVNINFDNDKENIDENIKLKRNSTNANLLLSKNSSKSILRPAMSFKSIKSIKSNLKKKISFGQIELLS